MVRAQKLLDILMDNNSSVTYPVINSMVIAENEKGKW